jgi:phage major head subunit gpT-like protein
MEKLVNFTKTGLTHSNYEINMANMVNMTNSGDGKQAMKPQRTNRFVVMLTDQEVQSIEDHRFANRIGTASEAARSLIRDGLKREMPAQAGE